MVPGVKSMCVRCVHTLRSVYATSAHTYARMFNWCESHLSLFSVSTLLPLPFSCSRNSVAKFRRSPGGALTAVVKCYRWNLVQSFFTGMLAEHLQHGWVLLRVNTVNCETSTTARALTRPPPSTPAYLAAIHLLPPIVRPEFFCSNEQAHYV